MKHIFEQKVFYSDTDAYGVVWHGAYLRWMEMGRVELCEMFGHNLIDLKAQDIVLPIVNINIKYKMSARLNDEMIIETEISKFNIFLCHFKKNRNFLLQSAIFCAIIVPLLKTKTDFEMRLKE